MIKVIIFDFFDVIRQDAFHAWMKIHGYTREDPVGEVSRFMDTGRINREQFFIKLAKIAGQSLDELKSEFKANEKLDQDVIEIVKGLKKKYKIVLISNSDSSYLRGLLKAYNLDNNIFDDVFISSEVGHAKPDAEIFHHVLSAVSAKPEETLFIDDQKTNIEAAKSLGINGIIFKNAKQLHVELNSILSGVNYK